MSKPQKSVVKLPAVLDLNAASALKDEFLDRRGHALTLEGDEVQRLGGQCLQVLLSAKQAWSEDGCDLTLTSLSPDFEAALSIFGLTKTDLCTTKESAA